MKYEVSSWYAGAPENTVVTVTDQETCFCAVKDSEDAAYQVCFEMEAPIADTYILVPGCAYDGNRFETVLRNYPPMYLEEELGAEVPLRMTQVPHLKAEGDSFMDVTVGDLTVPCVCVLRKSLQKGFMIFFEQEQHGLNLGLTLEQKQDTLNVCLRAPAKRRLVYRWYEGVPSLRENSQADPPLCVKAGQKTVIAHEVFTFDCRNIPELYKIFFEKRALHAQKSGEARLPFSAFWDMAKEALNHKYFIEKEGFYSQVENNVLPEGAWQSGWVGSGMSTLSFLCDGDEESFEKAIRTLEFACSLQSPIGWFYGIYKKGKVYPDDFGYYGERFHMLLVRKHADLTYFLYKQIIALKKMGKAVPDWLSDSACRGADALVTLWETYGQLGQFVNAQTGELVVGNSASSGIAPAALCAAYAVTGNEKYACSAREIGDFYYRIFICTGVTSGGPGEILQAPDSESAAGLLESYVALYELDGAKWLQCACDAAHQLSSWVVSYDYRFPENSRFGKRKVQTVGSVWANVQNKHSAPGLCTLSAAAFLKLYRATEEVRYLELMQQISHFMPQVVSCPENPMYPIFGTPLGEQPLGWGEMCERVNMSDWEGREHVGDAIFGPSNWPQAAMMLTWTEIPGIYAVPDLGVIAVSDHMHAWLEEGELVIENPTNIDARVKIMTETPQDREKSLGFYWLERFLGAEVPARGCVRIKL